MTIPAGQLTNRVMIFFIAFTLALTSLLEIAGIKPAFASHANAYLWGNAACAWNGQTTGTGYWCSNYDWGYTTCPAGDGYCTTGNQINGYYQLDPRGYAFRNCTSYVANEIASVFGKNVSGWGNAASWDAAALNAGYTNDSSPQVGDIAQWNGTISNPAGHVAYVYAVTNGVASYAEYNYGQDGNYLDSYTSSSQGAPSHYIHIQDVPKLWALASGGQVYYLNANNNLINIPGTLAHIDSDSTGVLWGLDSSSNIYYSSGSSLVNIPGKLAQISAGGGSVWGLSSAGGIYHLELGGLVNYAGTLASINVGSDGTAWGLDSNGHIYRFINGAWVNYVQRVLTSFDVNSDGNLWGIDANGHVYDTSGSSLLSIPGSLAQISVSGNTAWGLSSAGGTYEWQPSTWVNYTGTLASIEVGTDTTAWGLASNGYLYDFVGGAWNNIPGVLYKISAP
jgi:surface antigen